MVPLRATVVKVLDGDTVQLDSVIQRATYIKTYRERHRHLCLGFSHRTGSNRT
jgi:hypothetical protein